MIKPAFFISVICLALLTTCCIEEKSRSWTGDHSYNIEKAGGIKGKAYRFNGNDAYITGIAPVTIENEMSFSLWINSPEWAGGDEGILGNLSFISDHGWTLFYNGYANLLKFQININNNTEIVTAAPPLNDKWHLIAGTYDGLALYLFVDGKQAGSKEVKGKIINDNDTVVAGRLYNDLSDRYFKGALDEIMIYDRALSADEVRDMYISAGGVIEKETATLNRVISDFPPSLRVETAETSPADDWFEEIRSYVWDDIPDKLTLSEADAKAGHFASLGINVIFPEHYRYLFAGPDDRTSWFNSPLINNYIENLKVITEACHNNNIRVIGHLTACCVLDTYFNGHPEQSMIDLRDGKPAFFKRYGTYMMCPNNPTFRNAFNERVKIVMKETDLDGLMIDETEWLPAEMTVCGCEYCRSLFKEKTGYDIPDFKDPSVFGNYDNEIFRAWLKFRIESMGNFLRETKMMLDSLKENVLLTGCYCEALSPFVAKHYGMDLEDMNRALNFSFFECEPANPWSWRYNMAEASYYRAYGPSFYLGYSANCTQQFYNWAFAKTCGLDLWIFPEIKIEFPYNWEKKWAGIFVDEGVLCNTALVFSSPSKNFVNDAYLTVNEFQGWAQALTEDHIPFETLIASQLCEKDLTKYSVIVLPDVTCLSAKETDILAEWVRQGGSLICTGRTGQYDETGKKRPEPVLDKLIADTRGKGRITVLNDMPGLKYYVPKIGGGRAGEGGVWKDKRDRISKKKMLRTINERLPYHAMKTKNIPQEVLIMPYYQKADDYSGITIHLLNCLGTRFEKTISVPENKFYEYTDYPSPNSFLKKGESMKIAVRPENVRKAYLISADFHGVMPLDFETEDGYCEVTIPDLGRYEIIYLITGEKDLISDFLNGSPVIKHFPPVESFPLAHDSISVNKNIKAGII